MGRFLNTFFFSSHTLTTVGYGNIWPKTVAANFIAAFEGLVGVLGFAVATGLLFGRISRPSARLGFSENALIAPYQDGSSLQFRVVNRRSNSLVEANAQVLLMTVEREDGKPVRRYHQLTLERSSVLFLALTWTVVHPIDEHSPLHDKTAAELAGLQAEIIILIKAYDDTFSQNVISRHSYRHDQRPRGRRIDRCCEQTLPSSASPPWSTQNAGPDEPAGSPPRHPPTANAGRRHSSTSGRSPRPPASHAHARLPPPIALCSSRAPVVHGSSDPPSFELL